MTSAVEYVQLAFSCTATNWFLGIGAFLLLAAVGGMASGEGLDEAAGCCGLVLVLIVGGALLGVGVNSLADGCQ
ncbi:hypothetical protein [Streptomyces sp. NBC_00299]|uniref:hypothetical protein n=1 Tax=Streptomyces sp. NBC_00299 TaxID=2975705 RepID=UPI002E2E8622|nr:hypothetical protein [Streptomyces sp. NBC_00299]